MSRRHFIFVMVFSVILVGMMIWYSNLSFAQQARFYNFIEDKTSIGRDSFEDQFRIEEAEISYVTDLATTYPILGEGTQIAVLKVKITNETNDSRNMGVLNDIRLLDAKGRLYAPSWVQYPEDANQFIRETPNIRIAIFNPDTPQYRYIIFLVPDDIEEYRLVSTDKTLNQPVPIVSIEELINSVPEEVPNPLSTPSTGGGYIDMEPSAFATVSVFSTDGAETSDTEHELNKILFP